jgi:hypothetical protein
MSTSVADLIPGPPVELQETGASCVWPTPIDWCGMAFVLWVLLSGWAVKIQIDRRFARSRAGGKRG